MQGGTIMADYTYLSDGTKCGVADNSNNGYDYLGSLVYSRSGSTRTFESAVFGGGRIVYSSGAYSPYYYTTDHLGSTRVITNSSGTVVERNDYYPFGGKHSNASYPQLTVNRQKFNGKELQTTGNTGFLDYGARMYDDVIGRWGVVDPMAEKYPAWTPYVYTLNNPIKYVDPDGRDAKVVIKGNTMTISTTIYVYGSGATKSNAALMQNNIMNAWSKDSNGNTWQYKDAFSGKTYDVIFDITVEQYDASNQNSEPGLFSGRNNPFNTNNYVEIDNSSNRSFVRGGDEGTWRGKGRNGKTLSQDDSSPHEFGHILGLPDRYTNSKGANKGWKGNIMAEPAMQGVVEQRDINKLVEPLVKEYKESLTKTVNDKLRTNLEYKTKIDP